VSILNVFSYIMYISLCMGPFFGRFYFYSQTLQIMSKECCILNSFTLDYWFTRRRALHLFPYILSQCKMKRPLVKSFLGRFYFYAQIYKPCPKDDACQISEYLDCQFMRRRCFKIHQFYPFLPLIGSQ